jgi:hypothetical protein
METALSPNERFMDTAFTGKELRNAVSFDPDRQLRGASGQALLDEVLGMLAETRQRALKESDAKRRSLTASILLANLAAAAINRVDPDRFVAVGFNKNAYVGTGLGIAPMKALRDLLLDRGMIEGRLGVRREDTFNHGYIGSSLTRLRATEGLRELIDAHGIGYPSIFRRLERGAFVVANRSHGVDENPPPDVARTVVPIAEMNALIASASVQLPEDAWARVVARRAAAATKEKKERGDAGDLAATALFRSFTRDWKHGGRLYGGWWINLPKEERPHLTIGGQRVVELDYSQLHPSILFARVGIELGFDLYTLPGLESPGLRDLGKDTFARLLNHTPKPGEPQTINVLRKHWKLLPADVPPGEYMRRFRERLEPVERWLLIGEGLRLQREDSDLALDVLRRMGSLGIVALPVHDSFIVQASHGAILKRAMEEAYRERWGFNPRIKGLE